MYSSEEILEIFKEKEVLLTGHFRLTSGRHAGYYMQCARLLQYPETAGPLIDQLVQKFADDNVTIVIGPAIGAIPMAYEAARSLKAKALFAERENGAMTLRRGFAIEPSDRVLVVEDVITTGGSVKEVIELVKSTGATIVGAAVIVDRSAGKIDLGVPLTSLVSLEIESYDANDCPICAQGKLPVIKPGSRS